MVQNDSARALEPRISMSAGLMEWMVLMVDLTTFLVPLMKPSMSPSYLELRLVSLCGFSICVKRETFQAYQVI